MKKTQLKRYEKIIGDIAELASKLEKSKKTDLARQWAKESRELQELFTQNKINLKDYEKKARAHLEEFSKLI